METYGDESFRRTAGSLFSEIDAECIDVLGWFAVLWARGRGRETLKKYLDIPASAFLLRCRLRQLEELADDIEKDVPRRRRKTA